MTERTKAKEMAASADTEIDVDSLLQPFLTSKEMCFLRVQKLYVMSMKVPSTPSMEPLFMARVQDLSSLRKEYDLCVKEVNSISKLYIPHYVPTYSEIDAFDELYYAIRMAVRSITPEPSSNAEHGLHENCGTNKRRVKLPELQIPKFDSKLENWITFRDTFLSLIHHNASLSNIEKMYYLIASVISGPALVIVKSMPVTADNYLIVWNALLTRFDNRRALAASYVDKMFTFKPLNQESAVNLNSFLQTFKENITALEQLKIPDLSSFLLFQMALRNLDPVTRREFEQTKSPGDIPTVQELLNFVEKQSRVLELSTTAQSNFAATARQYSKPNDVVKPLKSKPTFASAAMASRDNAVVERLKSSACPCCQKPHAVYRCPMYNALTPQLRTDKVKQLRLCGNCLRDTHTSAECTSKYTCTVCKDRHHSSLHLTPPVGQDVVALACSTEQTVLLGTAVIHIQDVWGRFHAIRALIDSGAMSSYITQDCAKILGLSRRKCDFRPVGLGGNQVQNFGLMTCKIKPLHGTSPVLTTDAVIVTNIAGNLPTTSLPAEMLNKYHHLELADPAFHNCAPVHMLIAGDLFPYIYCGDKIIPERPGMPVALKSIFGYVISGQVNLDQLREEVNAPCGTVFSGFSSSTDLNQVMNSFWEIENIPSAQQSKPDDVLAETMFARDHNRDPETGRYIVKYPLRPDHSLGDSQQMALRRLHNLESRLNRDPHLRSEYNKFMAEYETLGHMTCLSEMQDVDSKYLIPHFCIVKPSSTSTKYRCVFDASSRTSNQKSLNDVCLAGPKLQADINVMLINFRLHEICLSADICKCYRQTLIHKDQRPYQHILWRDSTDQPIKVYELNTITYGVASSPYLAIKVLHTLADSEAHRYPIAAKVLKTGFFMDDLLWSEPSIEAALQLQKDLRALLESAGFDLRKWSSNCPQVLEAVPEDHRETPIEFDDDLSLKVLGLQWQPASDCFTFKCVPTGHDVTKRTVLSLIGRLYDPMGFVSPCVFYAKCFMQKLWTLPQLGWDTRLPANLEAEWLTFIKELPLLSQFRHERHVTVPHSTYCRILGFADASTLGYAAVVYLYTRNHYGESKVSLLMAKSKVAPLKTISVPRLELMAAHLLAKLVKYVVPILHERSITVDERLLFTDSSVVLAWLNTPSYKLKTFVATRVTKILDTVPSESFSHVSGDHNSCADVLSRGAFPSALLAMPEWLHGPTWLSSEQWPVRSIKEFTDENVPELKPSNESKVMASTKEASNIIYELTEKYSNYSKLVNVVAWIQKFIKNCRTPKQERTKLSLNDLKQAREAIIKSVQQHHFAEDITALSKGLKPQTSLLKLNPFVDANGFLRVGGRLSLAELSFDKKHPVLLPKKCSFTDCLINYHHVLYLHIGPRTLQSILSQKYWIVSARNVIRLRTRKCIACFKVRPTVRQPLMGQLPKFRTQDVHTFHTVAIDIGGPYQTKESIRRNARVYKSYLIVYVCCSSRALFLDTLTSLSAECFLASFDRFTARRGLCHTIISDNATNFVSAGRQLAEVSQFLQTNADELSIGLTKRQIHWKRNPPTGSHFGGLYEAAIRSAKDILKRTTANRTLTFEELTTLFARVEAVLNSRPLCALSTDPSEFEVLTPAHFLIGRELLQVPEYELTSIPTNRLSRWQAVQQMAQQFWRQWRKNFLHTLQERQKWFSGCRDLKVGDLVLVHSDAPPLQWPLGRVTKLHTGPDNVTRVVTIRTKNSEFIRPLVKSSPLPIDEDSSN